VSHLIFRILLKKHYSSFDAAKLAIEATQRCFNDLRKDLGDSNFDRLFGINPTKEQIQAATIAMAARQRFHFLTSTLSIGLSSSDLNFEKTVKQRIQQILSILFDLNDSNAPTYDLSDNGVDKTDVNIHSGSLLIDDFKTVKRRRLHRHGY
jgi:hypothetical protein